MIKEMDSLLISDPKIWAMPVKECDEPLVDVRSFPLQISPRRASFYDGFTKVRQSVAEKLIQASRYLPTGLTFLFSEGHRPISLQRKMFEEYYNELAGVNPQWSQEIVYREASKFIAPPQDVPPHSTGGAIDITLADGSGREVDMGSLLDEAPTRNENRNYTYAENISPAAKAHRQILINALSEVGFINYPTEWWHWSYGDKYWAYYAKQPYAIYGTIE